MMSENSIRAWAAKGAALRLAELHTERQTILGTFPELQTAATPLHAASVEHGPAALHAALVERIAQPKRPHWTQTPEGRAKLSASLKKHWRKRNRRMDAAGIPRGTR